MLLVKGMFVGLYPVLKKCECWIISTICPILVCFRHVIAPEISLYNAKIVYQWNIALDSGSIRTKVDPTSAVHVTWTDNSMTGKWVTDFRIPLVGTTPSALAADVRVRRQFTF